MTPARHWPRPRDALRGDGKRRGERTVFPPPPALRHFRFLTGEAGSSNVSASKEPGGWREPHHPRWRRGEGRDQAMSERRTRSGGAAQGSGERRARGRDGAQVLEGRSSVREAHPLPPEEARTGKAPPTGLFGNLGLSFPGRRASPPPQSLRRSQRKSGSDLPNILPEIWPKVSPGFLRPFPRRLPPQRPLG